MNIAHLLRRAGRSFGDRVALRHGAAPLQSFAALSAEAARIGGGLVALGVKPGDAVAIVMSNHIHYLAVLYGVWWAGGMAVPVNVKLHPKELAHILSHCGAGIVVTTPDVAATVSEATAALERPPHLMVTGSAQFQSLLAAEPLAITHRAPTDTAWLFYTSGTTGRPKGAMLPHRALYALTTTYFIDIDAVEADDTLLHAAPMSHGSGLYNFQHIARGAAQSIPESGGFDAGEILALSRRLPALSLFAAPTMVKRLVDYAGARGEGAGDPAPGLKTVIFGGGPMHLPDVRATLAVFGPRLAQLYGQGESPMTITGMTRALMWEAYRAGRDDRLASAGIPQTICEVAIADPERPDGYAHPLPDGEAGEILVRGDSLMTGYWRDPEATSRTLRGGWLHTGDVGAFSADGYLTLKDRSKDLIITGGSNVYPREVEDVLLAHPGVAEAAVAGAPDPEWGESVVAFIVPRPGTVVTEEALDRLCLDAIARFKRPKRYVFLDALPKNAYGKVLKTELRQRIRP